MTFPRSRRDFLRVGSFSLGGLSLSHLLQAQDSNKTTTKEATADACIILFLNGGPSHLDMWDMKPETGEGIRGEFQPIATSIGGYQMCELLPTLAQQIHRTTVVRSMHHSVNNAHAAAVYTALTGHDRGEIGGGTRPTDNPAPGSVTALLRPPEQPIVPFVHLPYMTKEGAKGPPQPGFFGGYLGRSWDPLFVLRDPNADNFAVPELSLRDGVDKSRFSARRELFEHLKPSAGDDVAMTRFQERALDLLTSPVTQQAFRLSEESDSLRDQYGRNIYGQSTLLARRLIEAGTRVVTLSWAPDANATWDTHGNNFKSLRNTLLPQFDAACGTLLADLAERGMLERTVVAVMGDFGRTPKINANAGRDHWNFCYSLMLAGGGFREGLIYGASDSTGAFPESDPLIPGDIIATLYQTLGISEDTILYDSLERPHRLIPIGDVIPALLG
ncbi:MAG: DUF1501 domain-containing protein [Planctomycetaceae bacterium]|nr:DUF1501 domain-containing protein [Planctomycetaceae bacterium]